MGIGPCGGTARAPVAEQGFVRGVGSRGALLRPLARTPRLRWAGRRRPRPGLSPPRWPSPSRARARTLAPIPWLAPSRRARRRGRRRARCLAAPPHQSRGGYSRIV